MWHITRLSPYPALNRFTFHAPASSYSTLLVNDNQRIKQKADSREPGGKQDKDTGDLFFTSTSLTKNPLLTMFSWLPNLASPPSHRLGAAFLLNTGIMRRQGAVLETWLLLSLNLFLRFIFSLLVVFHAIIDVLVQLDIIWRRKKPCNISQRIVVLISMLCRCQLNQPSFHDWLLCVASCRERDLSSSLWGWPVFDSNN